MSAADYELWKSRELQTEDSQTTWPGGEDLMYSALRLVAENQQAGKINGQRLLSTGRSRGLSQTSGAIVKICSRHSHARAAGQTADKYRQLRRTLYVCLDAPVMLTQNKLWGVPVVPLGLMNGARGRVVAIVYSPAHQRRLDGRGLSEGPPGGHDFRPLPAFIVAHFPGYLGAAIFPGLPRTWVPVPAACIHTSPGRAFSGRAFP